MNEDIVVAMRGLNSALRTIQKARSDTFDMLGIWANRLLVDGTELTSPNVVEAENLVKERIKVLRTELQDSPDSAEIFASILTEYESELETMPHVVVYVSVFARATRNGMGRRRFACATSVPIYRETGRLLNLDATTHLSKTQP